jgi:VWFA-related protein
VILIDDLFSGSDPTNEEGSSLSRVQALKALRSIPAGEKIAVYALRGKLQVICEFTSDRDLPLRQLRKWKPTATTPAPEPRPSLQALINPAAAPTRGDADAEFARIDMLQRASAGDAALGAIADHLAGVPGRKNLILLANKFPIGPRAMQKLIRAGVSIYPVDIDGVCRLCPVRPKQEMDGIAAATGGVAYYGRNDLDSAIREAVDDGRVSYTLGYYQPSDEKVTVHKLGVRASRPGVTLRYRASYETEAPPAHEPSVQELVQAMNRPVDATGIAVTVSVTRAQDRLDLSALVDVSNLDLTLNDGLWKGQAEIVARFLAADATQAGDVFAQTATFNLQPGTYASELQDGVPYRAQLTIPPNAVELKLLVGNLASGRIGTLTIPLSAVGPAK